MKPLNLLLRLNAASCLGFGALFVLQPEAVAAFLGAAPALLVSIIGAVLIFNGLHLVLASLRKRVITLEIWYFSFGDLAWVTLTIWFLALGLFITTPAGAAAALIVAAGVGALGLLQLHELGKADRAALRAGEMEPVRDDHMPADLPLWTAIGRSWSAMKLWVKIWLFALNAVFILAAAFWPEPLAVWTLTAYLVTGPWLFAIMIAQRGLTRFLGLAHIAAWTPLMVYLSLRLAGDMAGSRIDAADAPMLFAYAAALWAAAAICLALDVFDVWRWLRGERFRLGSPSAARAGASALASGKGAAAQAA